MKDVRNFWSLDADTSCCEGAKQWESSYDWGALYSASLEERARRQKL